LALICLFRQLELSICPSLHLRDSIEEHVNLTGLVAVDIVKARLAHLSQFRHTITLQNI